MKTIELNQFLDFKYINGLKVNQEKTQSAFTVAKADIDKNEYHHTLYTFDGTKVNKEIALKTNSQFIWDLDQTILIKFAKTKQEIAKEKEFNTFYYRYDYRTKKLSKAFDFSFPGTIVSPLNQGYYLLSVGLTKDLEPLLTLQGKEREALIKANKQHQLIEEIEEIPFYFNGQGFISGKRNRLYLYHPETKELIAVTEPTFQLENIHVSRDLNHLYYSGFYHVTGKRSLTSVLKMFEFETKETKTIYDQAKLSINHIYEFNQKIVVLATDMKMYGLNENEEFYRVDGNELKQITHADLSVGNSVGTDVRLGGSKQDFIYDNKLHFVATTDDHTSLYSLDTEGHLDQVYQMDGSIDGLAIINKQIYLVGLFKQKLQELYAVDLNEQSLKRVSSFNQRVHVGCYVAKPKPLIYREQSHEVKGYVLYPKDYVKGQSYPMILDIHGGPKTVYGSVYYHEMQVWANRGYFVIFANPRGSDGKGNAFADIRGKYGTIDYDDLMHFTNLALKKINDIDPNRLFVTGGSYGGFMTNWMVGHTDRFKRAATQRSISNWISFYGTSDIGYYFAKDQTDGHPNLDTDKLWEQSPLKYTDRIVTPLLFIHSDEDYRCPIEQALQMYTILKEKGVETKLVWFKGETHELSRSGKPQARIKRLQEITDWFEKA